MKKKQFAARFYIPLFISFMVSMACIGGLYHYLIVRQFSWSPLIPASIIRYAKDPVCLFIGFFFLFVFFYGIIQYLSLLADKVEFNMLIETLKSEEDQKCPSQWFIRLIRLIYKTAGRKMNMDDLLIEIVPGGKNAIIRSSEMRYLLDDFIELHRERLNNELFFMNFGIWVLPILGFIGTVLGISHSVVGLNELMNHAASGQAFIGELQGSMGKVLSGLSTAFDTTFLGLSFSILVMFPTVILKRLINARMLLYYVSLIQHLNADRLRLKLYKMKFKYITQPDEKNRISVD